MSDAIATVGPLDGYRPCVGVMLFNPDGLLWMGKRCGLENHAWQMPQGGIDKGEMPEEAALRELKEEIGTDKALIAGETQGWLSYDLPDWAQGKAWDGRWPGQTQKWFACRFIGDDSDIDIAADDRQEFDDWRWTPPADVLEQIVDFKRGVYREMLEELSPLVDLALATEWSAPTR